MVSVSFPGLKEYSQRGNLQAQYLTTVKGVIDGRCANFGAFTGFMNLFEGAYREAHATVTEEMGKAVKAAEGIRTAFKETHDEYKRVEKSVEKKMGKTVIEIDPADPYSGPAQGEYMPGVPRPIKYGGGVVGNAETISDRLGQLPKPIDDGIRGTPAGLVGLIADGADTISAGQSLSEGNEDERRYENFENKHGDDE